MHRHMGTKILFGLGLAAGAGMLLHRMAEHRPAFAPGAPGAAPTDPSAGYGWQRRWAHGYPPIFDAWHQQAHAQAEAKPQDAAQAQTPPAGPAAYYGWHRRWGQGFPSFFDAWHQQAHAQAEAKPQSPAQPQTPPPAPAEPTQA